MKFKLCSLNNYCYVKSFVTTISSFSCVVYSFASFELFYFWSIALYGFTMYISLGQLFTFITLGLKGQIIVTLNLHMMFFIVNV
jgi:hypothetical protein